MEHLINGGRPFLTQDAGALGLSKKQLQAARDEHRLRSPFRGVYLDSRVPDDRDSRACCLDLVRPDGAVFYGETVAWLHGLDVFRPGDRHQLVPRCIVPHGGGRARRSGVICHEGYISARDVETVGGLTVTTPLRTVCDLLRTAWRPYALAAADAFAHAGLVDPDEVRAALVLLRGYPGIRQARALAELTDPGSESAGESWSRLRLIDSGLPAPHTQVRLLDRRGREVARLDMGYEELKVAVEFDGGRDHTLDDDVRHDAERRRMVARRFGWRVVVVTGDDVWGDGPRFEDEVAELLGLAALSRSW